VSQYLTILEAVQTRVAGVSGGVPVVIRRRPQLLNVDTLPCIVVAPAPDGESVELEAFNRHVTWAYPVYVVVFSKGNRELTIAPDDFDLREAVRNEIYQPLLSGAGTVYDIDLTLSGPFNLRSTENTTETDAFKVIYKSSETRSA
jgi:hypothetical protein